jgi:hypothetical protein
LRVGHGEHLDEQPKEIDEGPKESDNLLNQENDSYSVVESHVEGTWNVFTGNLVALFRKRFAIYKRSFKTFIVEILIPILLVILGLSFTKI